MMRNKHRPFLAIMMLVTLHLCGCSSLAYVAPEEKLPVTPKPVSFTLAATSTPTLLPTVEIPAADLTPTPIEFVESQTAPTDISAKTMPVSSHLEEDTDLMTPIVTVRQTMNIRGGPGTVYPVVGSAVPDETFTVLGRNEDSSWVQVVYPAVEQAWLYVELVEITGDMQAAPLIPTVDIPPPPAETDTHPVVSTAEEPEGTIYFITDKPERLSYFDPATGGYIDISVEGQEGGIYKLNPDGANLTQLHPALASDQYFDISPDRQKMLYYVETGHDIYLSNLDGSNAINLTNTPNFGENYKAVWLPDGQRIVYLQTYDSFKRLPSAENFFDIYVLDVNQAAPLNLTNHSPGRIIYRYAVSPKGQQVIFISEPASNMGPPPDGMDFVPDLPETLSVINLDGTGRLDLIDNPSGYELRELSWSPDSQKIALTVGDQQEDGGFRYDIHLINPDGTQQVNITNTPDADESRPVWSPNGQQLVVACNEGEGGVHIGGETSGIQFFNRDGTAQTACINLPNTYSAEDIKWSPDGQRVAIRGTRYLVDGEWLVSPQTMLFTIRADGTDLIQITDPNLQVSWHFAWSPGSEWLVYAATSSVLKFNNGPLMVGFTSAEEARTVMEHKIYVGQADGSRIIPLTKGDFGPVGQIEWQP